MEEELARALELELKLELLEEEYSSQAQKGLTLEVLELEEDSFVLHGL